LALGIGANTALFSVIDGLMLKPLRVRAGSELRILTIVTNRPPARVPGFSFSYPFYEDVQKRTDLFSGVIACGSVNPVRLTVGGTDGAGAETTAAEVARGQAVSGTFFSALGVNAGAGRVLDSGDDRFDAPAVAMLSDGFWARRFGRDPGVIGRAITVNEVPFTIVGVAPAGFQGFQIDADPELWWSLHVMPRVLRAPAAMITDRMNQSWWIVGRMQPRVEDAQAQAQLEPLFKADANARREQLGAQSGAAAMEPARRIEQAIRLESGAAGWTTLRWQFRRPLLVLMSVVALVLLIACANVANLLLARATARRKEISVRMALGSGRPRVVRQLLTESIMLAAIGGVVGIGVAFFGTRAIGAFIGSRNASLNVAPDDRVLAFTAVVSLASAVLFGLVPALTATRVSFTAALNEQGRATPGTSRLTIHNAIVASQVALSVVVLIAAGLFIRSLTNLQRLDTGIDSHNLTVVSVRMPSSYTPARRMDLYERLLQRLESIPGTRASYSMFGVMSGNGFGDRFAVIDSAPSDEEPNLRGILVGPDFFDVVGTRIVAGRGFEPSDARSPVRVAVVNETMARRFFGARPLGKRFTIPRSFPGESFEIVGIAVDSKYRSLREEAEQALPIAYLPTSQPPGARIVLSVRIVLAMNEPDVPARLEDPNEENSPNVPNDSNDQADRPSTNPPTKSSMPLSNCASCP
jgi:predicted permease